MRIASAAAVVFAAVTLSAGAARAQVIERPGEGPGSTSVLQLDLSVGPMWYHDALGFRADGIAGQGALAVAVPMHFGMRDGFLAPTLEGTADGGAAPFGSSVAAGLRAGWAFSFPGSYVRPLPDLVLYGRVTPFAGFERGGGVGVGIRGSVGLTSARWAAFAVHDVFGGGGFEGSMQDTIAECFFRFFLALVDHAEIVAESYQPTGGGPAVQRFGFRIGTGF